MFERKPFIWEVQLMGPDKKARTEKVQAYWSPSFPGIKESIAVAARCAAVIRNKGGDFGIMSEPTLLGKLGDESVAA